jgi:hypothetical protein
MGLFSKPDPDNIVITRKGSGWPAMISVTHKCKAKDKPTKK